MRTIAALFVLLPSAALAHDSFAPHSHPHGLSVLPEVTTLVIGAWGRGSATTGSLRNRFSQALPRQAR